MSLVAILNETFENESAGKVKKEMKEKILIAIFFGAIMLLVPFTAIAREADVRSMSIEGQKEEILAIELTMEELRQIHADFRDLLKEDYLELYQIVVQAFNDAVTIDRNDVIELDLEKFKSGITPETSYELKMLQQIVGTSVPMDIYKDVGSLGESPPVQQTAGSNLPATSRGNSVPGGDGLLLEQTMGSSVPATPYNSGGMGFDLSAEKQTAVAVPVVNGDNPIENWIENYSSALWNGTIQPYLGDSWPLWREGDIDGTDVDVDGPEEEGAEGGYEDDGYGWRGLDDYMDWNCNAAFWWLISICTLALVLCLVFLIVVVGLIGLISVLLGYISSACLFLEAFDFKDLPYQYWNSGWDEL